MRKVKMVEGENRHIGDEYADAIAHFYEIITEVAKKYIDLSRYEIWTENWADVVNEGLPVEYHVQYLDVILIDKATKREKLIGRIDIGDDEDLTEEERDNEYIMLYDDDDIREAAEELFAEWAKEVEA